MANHQGQRDPWLQFLAAGENAKGLVAETANNTTVNAGWFNNDTGEIPPNPDFLQNQNIPQVVQVTAHTRKPPSGSGSVRNRKR